MAPAFCSSVQRRGVGGARGLDHGLVFGRVLVGLEQNLVQLLSDRLAGKCPAPSSAAQCGNLLGDQALLLDGGQGLGNSRRLGTL